MPGPTTTLGPFTGSTFAVALALACLLAALWAVYALRPIARPSLVVDVLLGGLTGAVIGARLVHVLLNGDYFGGRTDEIARLNSGGLDWHGALIGGLVGLALAARWRRLPLRSLLDTLAPALPLLALGGWYGCRAAACGYGAEVDTLARYPAWAVSEARDVYSLIAPRYNTQVFGMGLALVGLLTALALARSGRLRGGRFWLVLALLSAGMFAIGFVRGDATPIIAGLRADQWLDAVLLVFALALLVYERLAPANTRESDFSLIA